MNGGRRIYTDVKLAEMLNAERQGSITAITRTPWVMGCMQKIFIVAMNGVKNENTIRDAVYENNTIPNNG